MNIEEVLQKYRKCPFYNEQLYEMALNNDAISLVNIGTDFVRGEMPEYAVVCWQYIVDSGKGTAEAYTNLGVSYYYGNGIKQDYKKAVQYYQKAAAKGHPFGMYNLAAACESGNGTPKDMKKAIMYYKMAAEKGVNMAIDALIRLGLYDEINGLAFYGRTINDDSFVPTNNYHACLDGAKSKYGLAMAEYGTILGDILKKEAIQLYLEAISYKETSEAYYGLATLYKDFQEYDNAIKYYKETIRINPSSYKSYNDMGYCYYQMEDDINALECFKQSYEINPNSMVLRNMGNCYKNIGEIELSEKCYYDADLLDMT